MKGSWHEIILEINLYTFCAAAPASPAACSITLNRQDDRVTTLWVCALQNAKATQLETCIVG